MDGHLSPETLLALAGQELAPEAARVARAHVDACDECRRRLVTAQGAPPVPRLSPTVASPAPSLPARRTPVSIGRYRVLRELGRGAMGVVLLAEDTLLGRQVALKAVGPTVGGALPEHVTAEARAIARLQHPNVVGLFDVLQQDGQVYLAMEYVEGGDLQRWMEGAWTPPQRLAMFLQVASGLEAAHGAGVVHRDFKPANVLVGSDGRARVSDFGLAAMQGERDAVARGAVVGTPAYMSPEQFAGKLATATSDQFSFCVALYEALAGQRPFAGDSYDALRAAVQKGPPAMPPVIPPKVAAVLRRGLATEPRDRHGSMRDLRHALEAASRVGSGRSRVAAVAGVVVLLAGGAFAALRTRDVCQLDSTRLHRVWPPATAGALPDVVRAALEDTVADWRASYLAQCTDWREGRMSEPEWDRARGCLESALDDVDAVASAAAAAGPDRPSASLLQYVARPHACASAGNTARTRLPSETGARQRAVEALVALADTAALDLAGDSRAALARAEQAVELALGAHHPPTHARALLAVARFQYNIDAREAALVSLERARVQAMSGGAVHEMARADLQEAWGVCTANQREECQARLQRVRPLVETLDDPWLRALLLELRVDADSSQPAPLDQVRTIVTTWSQIPGATLDVARGQRRLVRALLDSGAPQEALELSLSLLPEGRPLGSIYDCEIALGRGRALVALGRTDDALAVCREVARASERLQLKFVATDANIHLSMALASATRFAEVLDNLPSDDDDPFFQVQRAMALVMLGRFDEGRQLISHLRFPLVSSRLDPQDVDEVRVLSLLVALQTKDLEVLGHAREWLGPDGDLGVLAAALTVRGYDAEAVALLTGAPPEQWLLKVELAQRQRRWADALALLDANAARVVPASALEVQLRRDVCEVMLAAAPAEPCARFKRDLARSREGAWFALFPNEVERMQADMRPRCR